MIFPDLVGTADPRVCPGARLTRRPGLTRRSTPTGCAGRASVGANPRVPRQGYVIALGAGVDTQAGG